MSDPVVTPIVVSAEPKKAQIEAGIRQAAAAAAIIATAFGASALAGKFNLVVTLAPQVALICVVVGPAVWGGITALGQLVTRAQAKKLAITAAAAPDHIATVK